MSEKRKKVYKIWKKVNESESYGCNSNSLDQRKINDYLLEDSKNESILLLDQITP